jgi:5-methyltetrahydropteroyltriglutamate--homocysteine methyltransferase
MRRSSERIITSHAGSLPRTPRLRDLVAAQEAGKPVDQAELNRLTTDAVASAVHRQIESGIDVPNDGEESKSNFTSYIRQRLSGIEERQLPSGARPATITGRDEAEFPGYFSAHPAFGGGANSVACVGPITYIGHEAVARDIANLKAALSGTNVSEAFLPAIAPGTIEHWLRNDYYPNDEEFLAAIANALHEEYEAIVDAGFVLQVDDPDLPDGFQMHPEMDVPAYQRFAALRAEAINIAVRGLPEDRVRLHVCWGSYKGPHKFDIPLADIIDLIFSIRTECYSFEASNPRHDHEWRVFETVKLPAGKSIMPGVIGHACDFVEHPELVAQRLVRYAELVGRENVIAGTDCGIGTRVGDPKICWAKFEAMAEGARIATKELWGRV